MIFTLKELIFGQHSGSHMKHVVLTISILISASLYAQELQITIDDGRYQVDDVHSIILAQHSDLEKFSNLGQFTEVSFKMGDQTYRLTSDQEELVTNASYSVNIGKFYYTLYFTDLPVISISTPNTIVNDPKVWAEFTYADMEQVMSSYIGIEIRGGVSQSFPKKTYDFELWQDKTGAKTWSRRFGDLRSDDDWILDALYNEPLRIRSYTAHQLWLEIHELHYRQYEPLAKAGADVIFAEVFLNGEYNGIYMLSEQVDKKQLKIRDYNGRLEGELYKSVSWGGACTYEKLPAYSNSDRHWGGYDYHYPEEDVLTDWSNLYNFTDFVMHSSDSAFKAEIWDKFNKENCMDYFIYMNVLRLGDNRGKNIFVSRYDSQSPYINSPWDLDACLGTDWRGDNKPRTTGILTNGLFRRAWDLNAENYKVETGNLWHHYRKDLLSNSTLLSSLSAAYNSLKNNNVYERESKVYPNYDFSVESLTYMYSWIEDRLAYLDTYFIETEIVDMQEQSTIGALIFYPNPAKNCIYLVNGSAAKNYVIYDLTGKPVKNGDIERDQRISVYDLSPGLYILRIKNSSCKLVVK